MSPSDAELMRCWQRGDQVAFEVLVRRWQGPVARFLHHFAASGGNGLACAVEDLCQETFLRVYQSGPRYREQGAFSTWLYRIALNVARDAGRKGRFVSQQLKDEDLPASSPTAEAACRQRETVRAVADALAELPEPQRLVLVLRHYEDLSFEQISRVTSTPASTLKSRFAVALKQLRDLLERKGWNAQEMMHELP